MLNAIYTLQLLILTITWKGKYYYWLPFKMGRQRHTEVKYNLPTQLELV